ncbi:hypothetical protein NSS79_25615 [Paenibacillus sp. FSL L8-0436]|uniref:hypothetical protein n=1 Tax=Paenibacillus sp. FSL L8-0436 TaxID=2954686 RepID=UPI0031598AE2
MSIIELLQVLLKGFLVTLGISLILFLIFLPTINRFSSVRALFRLGHRITTMFIPVLVYLFVLYVIVIIGYMIAAMFFDLPNDTFTLAYTFVTKIFLYILLLELGLHGISFHLVMHIHKATHKIQYERFGSLSQWGTKTREYKKELNWVPIVASQLTPIIKPLAANRSTLQILAPAANNGTEELEIAESLTELLQRKIRMRTSDSTPMRHQKSVNTSAVEFTYEQSDAFELTGKIKELQDIIYDPKGILWFTFGKEKKLLPALKLFYDLLSSDGIVIIDAPEKQKKKQRKNRHRLYFGLKLHYYCESSTYTHIEKSFKPGSTASKLFTLERVEGLSGAYGMAILRKIPAEILTKMIAEDNVG